MTLTKRKFDTNGHKFTITFTVLMAMVSQILNPGIALAQELNFLAKIRQNFATTKEEVIIKESIEGKLFGPALRDKPDRVVKGIITVYSSTPDQTDDSPFIAATGKYVHDGMIAANGLPFGTKIKIPALYGEKIFTVEDRMNARYGFGHFDIWMDAPRQELMKFGVKRLAVEIFYPNTAKELAMK